MNFLRCDLSHAVHGAVTSARRLSSYNLLV